MKIVCGSCQAKYSIADEKVAGKVFKIRCKRCSEVIVVRGDQEEAADAPSPAAAAEEAPADAIWHVVINGEQAGPYSATQLSEMMSGGQLDWEAYVWAEGFENWLPMRDIPDLVSAISGPAQREEPEPEPARAVAPVYAAAQPAYAANGGPVGYAVTPSMGADPFADDSATTAGVFGSAVGQPAARSNLFGGNGGDSPFESPESRVVASAPSPRVSTEQAMTGARNENSVLFSLKNLQALATGSSAPSASVGVSGRPGFAQGEGSGLIDIRALATATGVNDQGREASEKDALLSLGSAQAGAFGALGSPMLTPSRSDDESSKKGLVMAIVGGFALLAVAGIAAAVILKPAPSGPAVVAPMAPPSAAPAAVAVNPTPAPAAAAEPPSEGELAAERRRAEEAAKTSAVAASPSGDKDTPSQRTATRRGGAEKAAPSEPTAAKAEPAPKAEEKPKPKSGSSSIDDLLNDAIGSKGGSKGAASAPSTANLQEKPTREDVLSAMNGVKGAVSACAKGQTGVAFANVTVAGKTGRVSNVEVTGITGEPGSCIARTVRKAVFPKFKAESFQVKFPFRL